MDISRFKINTPRIVYETINEEVIAIDFDSGNYYSLNKEGSYIWSILEKGATISQILDALLHRNNSDRATLEELVTGFISQLVKENLIFLVEDNFSGTSAETFIRDDISDEKPEFATPTLSKYSDMQELLLLDPIHEVDERGWPMAITEQSDGNEELRKS